MAGGRVLLRFRLLVEASIAPACLGQLAVVEQQAGERLEASELLPLDRVDAVERLLVDAAMLGREIDQLYAVAVVG